MTIVMAAVSVYRVVISGRCLNLLSSLTVIELSAALELKNQTTHPS